MNLIIQMIPNNWFLMNFINMLMMMYLIKILNFMNYFKLMMIFKKFI